MSSTLTARRSRTTAAGVVAIALVSLSGVSQADLGAVMAEAAASREQARASQETVDAVADETEALVAEYLRVTKELDGLEVYNAYMERQLDAQQNELAELERSMEEISSIERQIMPLMIRMLDALEQFVALDVPFLRGERVARVETLRALMERSDVTVAEKFRRLTEAYLIENDYGRTIESYRETLEIDDATLEVKILRIGRVGLYYQTNDARRTGVWDRDAARWVELGGRAARNEVRRGIRIAGKQVAPELLLLDVPAPEETR